MRSTLAFKIITLPPESAPFAEFAWVLPIFGIVLLVLVRKQLFPGLYRNDDTPPKE
jgi:hypothetical protein